MNWLLAAGIGVVGGLVASAAMNGYQAVTAKAFGQDGGDGDPATVQAADDASEATIGRPVTQKHRAAAGSLVHYATGAALGAIYGVAVLAWPPAALGFGAVYGLVTAVVLDDLVVPAFGWGPWPWATPLNTHLYGLSSHVVFGLVLEGVRRGGVALLG